MEIYAIDLHTRSPEHKKRFGEIWTFDEFMKNIKKAKIDDIVIPILSASEDAAKNFDKPVELVFIDGDHSYKGVKRDFELWFPKVVEGGIMAFHDTIGWCGPKKVVKEFLFKSRHFKNVRFVGSITGVKVKENTFLDRIENLCVLFIKYSYESVRKTYIAKYLKHLITFLLSNTSSVALNL